MGEPDAYAVLEASFLVEVRDPAALPLEGPPEVAVAGRSNVGKSTLLNRLAGRRDLARVSKTPGRTRGLVFYELRVGKAGAGRREVLRFVDLPGYGYAKVSQAERLAWRRLVEGYLERRGTLKLVLVLLDARRAAGAEERQLCDWLESRGVPFLVAATKIDKLRASERGALGTRAAGRRTIFVSGHTGEGVAPLSGEILRAAGFAR